MVCRCKPEFLGDFNVSRIFIDGFEHGSLGLWEIDSDTGVAAIISTGVIDGNYSVRLTEVVRMSRPLGTTYNEIFIAGKFRFVSHFSSCHIFDLDKGTTRILGIGVSTAKVIHLYRGGTAIASATTGEVSSNVDYLIEFQAKIDSSAGVGKVLLDGATIINWTSNTKPGADEDFNILRIGDTDFAYEQNMVIDNIIVDTTAFPGNTKIMGLLPNAIGASTEWAPSAAGENFECVDEVPPTTDNSVHANTASALDLYNVSALNSLAGAIKCVQISALAEILSETTVPKVQIAFGHNSSVVFSASLTPGTAGSPAHVSQLWEENPITTAAFTPSEISSLQIGVKAATG